MDETKNPSSIELESVDIEKPLTILEGQILLDDIQHSIPEDFIFEAKPKDSKPS